MIDIPGYTVVERIGAGGMGVVYRAVHKKLGRQVAVKVLRDSLRSDLKLRRRFQNEARVMARLNHPNVVQLYDYMEIDDRLVLIMEYVPGTALDVLIRQKLGPVPVCRSMGIFEQVLSGVAHIHGKGIVHRDIKPSNILIRKDESVKISDMGIAKLEGQKAMTTMGSKLGSLYYMAPELVEGGEHTVASDIYAMGMTFYETLSGRIPMDEESSVHELMQNIIGTEVVDPRSFYPHIPGDLVQIVLKMLSKVPSERYARCEEITEALSAAHCEPMIEDSGESSTSPQIASRKPRKSWWTRTPGR